MSEAILILPHYTYDDYCRWEGRWELIQGIPYAMSPAPAGKHQRVVSRLHQFFNNSLDKSGCKHCLIYDFVDVKISDDTILQPDVLIACKEFDKFIDFAPILVVEILSPTTALKDRNTKFFHYQDFGVKYCVIINIEKQEIEIFCLNANGKYELANTKSINTFTFVLDHVGLPVRQGCKLKVNWKGIWD